MTRFLDTSVLIGYLVEDPHERGPIAHRLIDSDEDLYVSSVALMEATFVMTRQYNVPRSEIVDRLIDFIRLPNIHSHDIQRHDLIDALLRCRPSNRVSFGDALIWATARSANADAIYTFDRRFPTEGIDVIEPT